MTRIDLKSPLELEKLQHLSHEGEGVLIFKHSTRCGVSSWVWRQFESEWDGSLNIPVYFLDLLKNRDLSNKIAEMFGVRHESPQLIWLKNGRVSHHASHSAVSVSDIKSRIREH